MNRFLKSFQFAWRGIHYAFSEQVNFRFHLMAAAVVLGVGWYVGLTETEWLVIIMAIGGVITAELFNTAIEYTVNLISPEHRPLAGKIKDIAAAAVLVAAIAAFIAGIVVFYKYASGIFQHFNH